MHPSQLRTGQRVKWTTRGASYRGVIVWVRGESLPAEIRDATQAQIRFKLLARVPKNSPLIVRVLRKHAQTGASLKPWYYAPPPLRLKRA